jgi:hypothetical protein
MENPALLEQRFSHRERRRQTTNVLSLVLLCVASAAAGWLIWLAGKTNIDLVREKQQLESSKQRLSQEIKDLGKTKEQLEANNAALRTSKEHSETDKKLLTSLQNSAVLANTKPSGAQPALTGPPDELKELFERVKKDASEVAPGADVRFDTHKGTVVILGSYKMLNEARIGCEKFADALNRDVPVYCAMNGIYACAAAVPGATREALAEAQTVQPGAYFTTASRLPIRVFFKAPEPRSR